VFLKDRGKLLDWRKAVKKKNQSFKNSVVFVYNKLLLQDDCDKYSYDECLKQEQAASNSSLFILSLSHNVFFLK